MPEPPFVGLGPSVRALHLSGQVAEGQRSNSDPVDTNARLPWGQKWQPAGPRWWWEGGHVPLTPLSDVLPWPRCLPLAAPPWPPGRAGARAARGRHSPPKGPAPAPQEQAQQDAMRGSLEAFREEGSPGTRPAGKEVSWVCHSGCRSPDSRPRRLSTNGVCVGVDSRRASWRQEPKGEGWVAGEWQQVGWSADRRAGCKREGCRSHAGDGEEEPLWPRSTHFPRPCPPTLAHESGTRLHPA